MKERKKRQYLSEERLERKQWKNGSADDVRKDERRESLGSRK